MNSSISISSFSGALPTEAEPIIRTMSDIALLLSPEGEILWANQTAYPQEQLDVVQWVGQSLDAVVTPECVEKGKALIADAETGKPCKPRQLNHPRSGSSSDQSADSLAFDYRALRVGEEDQVLLIGRDLRQAAALQARLVRAQQALEHDYDRYRQTESRYRQIFHMASHPLLVVDPSDLSIIDANKAARAVLSPLGDINGSGLIGKAFPKDFAGLVEADHAGAIDQLLREAVAGKHSKRQAVELDTPEDEINVSFEGRDPAGNLILRMGVGIPLTGASEDEASTPMIEHVLEKLPDALVITNLDGTIVKANESFVEMTELNSREAVINSKIGRWLNFAGLSFSALTKSISVSNRLRLVSAEVTGEYGSTRSVEVSMTQLARDSETVIGLLLRDVSTRTAPETQSLLPGDSNFDNVSELIGQTSLKEIVRETTDVVERMCLETALAMTQGNRASAAELLGLSRQSLYIKMRRFGI